MKCKCIKDYLRKNIIPGAKHNKEYIKIDDITNVNSYEDIESSLFKPHSTLEEWGYVQNDLNNVFTKPENKDADNYNDSFMYGIFKDEDGSRHIKCFTTFNK